MKDRYIVGVFRNSDLILPIGGVVEVENDEQLGFLNAFVGSLDATYQQHVVCRAADQPEKFAGFFGSYIAFDFANKWRM